MRRLIAACLVALLAACGPASDPGADGRDAAAIASPSERPDTDASAGALGDPVSGFAISASRYAWLPSPQGPAPVPTLLLDLDNGSPITVARVTAHVRFFREGEDVPWWEQDFHFPVGGTLAPGLQGQATLTPAPDTDWALRAPPAEVPVRADATVQVLETPEGRRHPVASPAHAGEAP